MGQFEGGYTSAVNSENERTARDFTNQHLAQIIQERILQIQRDREAQDRASAGRSGAASYLFGPNSPLMAPGGVAGPFGAPGSQPPPTPGFGADLSGIQPQAPAPGQASVPMAAPMGAPPMDGNSGAPPTMPPGAPDVMGAGPENSPSSGSSEPQAAPPPGWQVSNAATPELGGPEPSMGGDLASPQAALPPVAQIPPGMTPQNLASGIAKMDLTPDKKLLAYEHLYPLALKQQQVAHQQFLDELAIKNAGFKAENAESARIRANAYAGGVQNLSDTRTQRAYTYADSIAARNAKTGTGTTAVGAPVGQPGGLTDKGLDLAAEEYRRNGKMPPLGMKNAADRIAIVNRAAEMDDSDGVAPGERVTSRMDVKAAQNAYSALTKDLAAIRPFNVMLDTNAEIAKQLAEKAIATDSQLANKPINWLRQNMGDNPDVAEYLAQIHFVATEAARVLNNPRLVGQLTDTAKREMQGVVNGDMPLNATIRVIDRMVADGNNRVNAMTAEETYLKSRIGGKVPPPERGAAAPAGTVAPDGTRINVTPNQSPAGKAAMESDIALKGQVEAAGQKYEPDKFDYKVEGGKVFRKPK